MNVDFEKTKPFIIEVANFSDIEEKAIKEPVRKTTLYWEYKLIGGYTEYAEITYDPLEEKLKIEVRFASQYGIEPKDIIDIKNEALSETVSFLGYKIYAEGNIDFNYATDEYFSWGEAVCEISIGKEKLRNFAGTLRKIIRKVTELADEMTEKAFEELVIPYYGEE